MFKLRFTIIGWLGSVDLEKSANGSWLINRIDYVLSVLTMWNSVFIVVFWFYTILRLFYSWRTSSEACVYPRHPSGFGCGRGVPRLPGFTLYSSDNPLRSRVLPEVYRGCNQDVGAKPSLPSLSRLYQSGCVGRGPPWRWGYGWSRWIWRMALKFKGNDSWWLTSSIANRISLSLGRTFAT